MVLAKRASNVTTSQASSPPRPSTPTTTARSPRKKMRNHKWSWVYAGYFTSGDNHRLWVAAMCLFLLGFFSGTWISAPGKEMLRRRLSSEPDSSSVTVPLTQLLLGKVKGDKAILPSQVEPVPNKYKDDLPPYGGKLTKAVYRVDSRKLGPRYAAAFDAFDEYIDGAHFDQDATAFAKRTAQHPAMTSVLKTSYEVPDYLRFHSVLERRKKVDTDGQPWAFKRDWYRVQGLDTQGMEWNFTTFDNKWHWGGSMFERTRDEDDPDNILNVIHRAYYDTPGQDYGENHMYVSGCFWYPPGAYREWHTNYDSARHKNNRGMYWRMYYVRQIPVMEDDGSEPHHHGLYNETAMHILEGPGLSGEYLESIGGLRLTNFEDGTPNAWRLPDVDGQVGFFRLQMSDPLRWHTIVSDGHTHRFSIGLGSHSDEEVAELLQKAGVEL